MRQEHAAYLPTGGDGDSVEYIILIVEQHLRDRDDPHVELLPKHQVRQTGRLAISHLILNAVDQRPHIQIGDAPDARPCAHATPPSLLAPAYAELAARA